MTAMITVTGIVGMNPELTEFKDKKKVRFSVASGSRKNTAMHSFPASVC